MYYEINVVKDGKHFFATAERSITNLEQCKKVLKEFQKFFKESEGYKISVKRYDLIGNPMDMKSLYDDTALESTIKDFQKLDFKDIQNIEQSRRLEAAIKDIQHLEQHRRNN